MWRVLRVGCIFCVVILVVLFLVKFVRVVGCGDLFGCLVWVYCWGVGGVCCGLDIIGGGGEVGVFGVVWVLLGVV